MRIILLGAPGVGKGTYADRLSAKYNISHISTGDILRDAVKNGLELGLKAKSFMDSGKLVPDDVIINMIKDRIIKDDCKNGFILDGFPRTVAQADSLKDVLISLSVKLDFVVSVEASIDTIVRRLTNRRLCKNCGANFNLFSMKPKKDGVCDNCNGELYQREDDKEEVIKRRLMVYKNDTEPLINYYKKSGILKVVNSDGEVKEVMETIEKIINSK